MSTRQEAAATAMRWRSVCGLALLTLLIYVPMYGLPLSIGLGVLFYALRTSLWGPTPRAVMLFWVVLALIGLWWPGMTHFLTGATLGLSSEVSTSWVIIPLCGPDSLVAWVVPSLAASVAVGGAFVLSVFVRRPWVWVLGAWLAPWVHHLILVQLPHHEFVC